MTQVIDCYGWPSTDHRFQKQKAHFYESATNGNNTYIRFSAAGTCAIHKITNTGTASQISWTYGVWENRENLTYDKNLNETIAIAE